MIVRKVQKSEQIFFRFVTIHAFDGQTDRRTNGQTDGQTDRLLIARPRIHFMQRGKNWPNLILGATMNVLRHSHIWCRSVHPTRSRPNFVQFDHVTADSTHYERWRWRAKVKVTAWRNISAVKRYKSGTNGLTDLKPVASPEFFGCRGTRI